MRDLRDDLEKYARTIGDFGMELGRRELINASSQLEGAKMIIMTLLTDDERMVLDGVLATVAPQGEGPPGSQGPQRVN